MSIAEAVSDKLLQINAIKLSPQKPFTWASGLRSPIYCDNRIVLSHPEIRSFVIDQFVEVAKTMLPFDAVAGVATAGIPHGALLADRLQLPFVYVRSKAKAHGRQNQIEGRLEEGQKVLVIEDLISTGGSCLQAVECLRAAGAEVVGVLAIFTYSFDKARQAFDSANCRMATLSNYEALIQQATARSYISPDQRATLEAWRMDPKVWSEQH
ncbi:MAG: orotate phosphoribosyltransferase [Saprospiraceae bacterium]|nr:orotate phosphoribosyltransferase [Saprospiraceae bacterium]